MRRTFAVRLTGLIFVFAGACLPIGGCGGGQEKTGTVVPTTEDEYKQMELENQANESETKSSKGKNR